METAYAHVVGISAGPKFLVLVLPCLQLQIPSLEPVKVVISGPSGVGKDAVIKALQASRPDLHFVVTATSRCALSLQSFSVHLYIHRGHWL